MLDVQALGGANPTGFGLGCVACDPLLYRTAIALETSKGELAMALALGVVLLALSVAINGAVLAVGARAERLAHA